MKFHAYYDLAHAVVAFDYRFNSAAEHILCLWEVFIDLVHFCLSIKSHHRHSLTGCILEMGDLFVGISIDDAFRRNTQPKNLFDLILRN